MQYCIATITHGEIEKYFNQITFELSRRFGITNLSMRVPAHITLKYPFLYDEKMLPKLEHSIKSIISTKQSCEFNVNDFGYFEKRTIFLTIAPNKVFEECFGSCLRELGEFNEDRKFDVNSFVPHVSIARKLTSEQFDSVWNYLQSMNKPNLMGRFNNISILEEIRNDNGWKIKREFRI